MQLPEFLAEVDGEIRLKGHRIGLLHIVELYNEGHSPEMIALEFDTLSLYQIGKVIDFYERNRAEVDNYVAQCRAEIDRQIAQTPRGPSLEELKRRWEAKHRAEGA